MGDDGKYVEGEGLEKEGVSLLRIKYPNEREDDTKKLEIESTCDGFAIYGRSLCLVVSLQTGFEGIKGLEI